MADIDYPDKRDHREIVLSSCGESATGAERKEVWSFAFDKVFHPAMSAVSFSFDAHLLQVFEPQSTQAEVFEEISQLAQSCIDGYHVCIFAYG